jgi:F420-non-reducing hydrogenase iron-sulfur subunit
MHLNRRQPAKGLHPFQAAGRFGKGVKIMTEFEPKIVSFLCNWCSYGAADLAGVGRMEYPSNIRVIRIPCTGRMSPKFFLSALSEGADAVWVSG